VLVLGRSQGQSQGRGRDRVKITRRVNVRAIVQWCIVRAIVKRYVVERTLLGLVP
jgi:hypothetical protein